MRCSGLVSKSSAGPRRCTLSSMSFFVLGDFLAFDAVFGFFQCLFSHLFFFFSGVFFCASIGVAEERGTVLPREGDTVSAVLLSAPAGVFQLLHTGVLSSGTSGIVSLPLSQSGSSWSSSGVAFSAGVTVFSSVSGGIIVSGVLSAPVSFAKRVFSSDTTFFGVSGVSRGDVSGSVSAHLSQSGISSCVGACASLFCTTSVAATSLCSMADDVSASQSGVVVVSGVFVALAVTD